MEITSGDTYDHLLDRIDSTLTAGRGRAVQAVNAHLLHTYWQIGHHIVEFEQAGRSKAEYGAGLIPRLSKDLTRRFGKGFGRSNVFFMRQFYLTFPKVQTLSGLLSWSHVVELLMKSRFGCGSSTCYIQKVRQCRTFCPGRMSSSF